MNTPGNAVAFRSAAARHRYSLQYSQPWNTGKRITIPLNNIGYLNEIQILLALTVTVGTAGTVTDAVQAKTNYLPFIGLRSPQGSQVWSTSSRQINSFNYRLQRGQNPTTDPSYATWAPSSATAQNVNLRLRIPCAGNDGRNFDVGMLMRQISNNQYFLDLQMAALSDLIGSGTVVVSGITGTITVEEIYYDAVIDGSNVVPPNFSQFIRLRGLQSPALVAGQNDVRYDTGPILTDAIFTLINNGAADGTISNLTSIEVDANRGNKIDYLTGSRIAYDNTQHLGQQFPAGVYHLDYNDDMEQVNSTLGRDFINSALAAQFDFLAQYAGVPTGASYIDEFFREIVTLAG